VTWPAEELSSFAIENIEDLHSRGEIDDISNLKDRAVYILSGLQDTVVPPHNQLAVKQQFEHFDIGYIHIDERDATHAVDKDTPFVVLDNLYRELGYIGREESLIESDDSVNWSDAEVGSFLQFS